MMRFSEAESHAFFKLISPYTEHKKVKQMKEYIQHGDVTTYAHCVSVAAISFWMNRRLKVGADEAALMKGAMLHDFYLYDWHAYDNGEHRLHGYTHPHKAAATAKKYFGLSTIEEGIIRNHMWPLTLFHMPTSKEAWIVCMADKYVSSKETVRGRTHGKGRRAGQAV